MIYLTYSLVFFFIIVSIQINLNCSQICNNKITCLNNGKFNQNTCSCDCATNYIGNDCSIDLCYKDSDKNCRARRKCIGQISNDRYEDACLNDEDCLNIGRGNFCCFTKTASYCQSVNSTKSSGDCVLFEETNYSGKKFELSNGQVFKNLKFDKQKHGFRSVKLKKNCKLKLCYDNLNNQKTCINHAFGSDEYKFKKQMPQYMSCFCDGESNSFIRLPLNLAIEMNKKIILPSFKLHHGEFTVRFKIKNTIKNSFLIRIGSILVDVSKDKIDLINNNLNLFKQIHLKQINHNENMMWISFKLLDIQSSFIKIGYGQTAESTNLITLNGPYLLDNQFDFIEFENIELAELATIEFKSFNNDPSPFLTPFYNGNSQRPYSFDLTHLPNQLQSMYNKMKIFKFDLENDLNNVNYSYTQKGCVLNKNNKRIIYKNGNELIKFEILPSNSTSIEYGPNALQLIKIIHGNLKFEWLNQNDYKNVIKSVEATQNDILWSTPQYYSRYRLTNINNDLTILIRAFYYLNSSNEILNIPDKNLNNFEQILNRCKLEFTQDKCDLKLHYNNKKCSFIGFKCGHSINYLINDEINDESLYACDTKSGELVEIENCYKFNKTCLNDEKCDNIKRIKAYVKLKSAYNNSIEFSELDGRIIFDQFDGYVKMSGYVKGLRPNSHHAIHIHEYSELGNNCRDTGPHFNPFQSLHGSPKDLLVKHAGDLGNLKTNEYGYAEIRFISSDSSFNIHSDNFLSVLYRSLVIHINRDDLGKINNAASKSNGNSGLRIACGIILPIN